MDSLSKLFRVLLACLETSPRFGRIQMKRKANIRFANTGSDRDELYLNIGLSSNKSNDREISARLRRSGGVEFVSSLFFFFGFFLFLSFVRTEKLVELHRLRIRITIENVTSYSRRY